MITEYGLIDQLWQCVRIAVLVGFYFLVTMVMQEHKILADC